MASMLHVSCTASDPSVLDVIPQGATAAYAAPEVLRSLQLQFEGAASAKTGVLVNGSSADWWSTGITLYELLTGELPFCSSKEGSVAKKVPEQVHLHCKAHWEDYECVRQLQQTWVSPPKHAFASSLCDEPWSHVAE